METIIDQAAEGSAVGSDTTLAESGFYWRESSGVKVLVCGSLEDAGFVNGFSTRLGGVSPLPSGDLNLSGFDQDSAENIRENRRRFLEALGCPEFTLATAWQTHSDLIKIVASREDAAATEEKYDALVASLENTLVGVKTADCVPVLIGDPSTRAFAAVHAGWRGSSRSIAAKAIETMISNFGARPLDMVAAIGPAAGCDRYEVGEEVIDAFRAAGPGSERYFTPTRPGHALVDLQRANRDQLEAAGIPSARISTAPFCTMSRTDLFFSYRVEKRRLGKTGRMLAVIGRKAPA
jgi:YfiH family protein